MKKHSFMESNFIATICLVFVKFLGLVYVIPFYAIIGKEGAALYAYAYTIYGMFLDISTAGIPNAIGKLINEFHTLGKEELKIRTYKLGKKILSIASIISFIIMFVFAPNLAKIIIDDLVGGNSISDVTFVVRCISFSLLLFPFLSVSRGFFQGHKYIYVNSISQVIEQVARVAFILIGSYVAAKCLNLGKTLTVGIAVFGAFIGGVFSFIYLYQKMRKNKKELSLDLKVKTQDKENTKYIFKRILAYSIPAIITSVSFSIYNNVDMILILRTMGHLGYSTSDVEFISTTISTWAPKISVILLSVGSGLMASLGPSVVEAYSLKKYDDVSMHFNRTMALTIFITLPMAIGISLLSTPIWNIFYGASKIGVTILSLSIIASLVSNIYTLSNYTLQSVNKFKMCYISSITGLLVNALLDVPLMLIFAKINLPPYWGATFATIIGFAVSIIIMLKTLKKSFGCNYKYIFNIFKKTLIPLLAMIIVIVLLKLIPLNLDNRLICILYVGFMALIGATVYFFIAHKINLTSEVLGKDFLEKLKNKFKIKKGVKNEES